MLKVEIVSCRESGNVESLNVVNVGNVENVGKLKVWKCWNVEMLKVEMLKKWKVICISF